MTSYVGRVYDASDPIHQPRPNRFGGACGSCGAGVKVGAGTFVNTGNRTVVMHLPGQCPAPAPRPNKYAGTGVCCGHRVEAGEGVTSKAGGAWVVNHLPGQCPSAPAPAKAPAKDEAVVRPNLYPGSCADCAEWVEAEAGRRFQPAGGGRWQVAHLPGGCPPPLPDGVDDGYYATRSATGNNDYDFWRVSRNDAGRIKVQRVIGGHADTPVNRTVGHAALTAVLAEGPAACGLRYGHELERCQHCNKHLTERASRELACGPDCADEHGLGETWQALNARYKAEEAAELASV